MQMRSCRSKNNNKIIFNANWGISLSFQVFNDNFMDYLNKKLKTNQKTLLTFAIINC